MGVGHCLYIMHILLGSIALYLAPSKDEKFQHNPE